MIISLLVLLISLFMFVLFVRGILSFISNKTGGLATLDDICTSITEPVVAPVRRVVPPMGGLDLSFIIVFVALYILRVLLVTL